MQISRGVIPKAKKVVIYGPEGIGKSTLASRFPDPVFIDTEGSTSHMDVARFDAPTSWQMLQLEIDHVKQNPACCRTLVIDTADWAEKLCTEYVLTSRKLASIEDAGYGKGYTYIKEAFGKMLNSLTDLIDRGVNVVITAHAMMRKFEQPDELGAYDRWELKLSKQTAPLVKEWADMVLFCNYKTSVINVDGQGARKGKNKVQGGKRVMYAAHNPCWDAKNRFGLPDELEMEYSAIKGVIETDTKVYETADKPGKTATELYQLPETSQEPVMQQKEPEPAAPESVKAEPAGTAAETKQETPAAPPGDGAGSRYFSDPNRLPAALRDLMEADNICEWDIQDAAFAKGYYPENTLIQDMDPEFISGWIIAFWPQVKELIAEIRKNQAIPFN